MVTAPPDPTGVDSVDGFIRELRLLKIWAGDPPLRRLARDSGLARSTLGDLLSPHRTRLPSLDLVLRYVHVCGVTGERAAAWRSAWREVYAGDRAGPGGAARPSVVPRQLPAGAARLAGRDTDLAVLDRLAAEPGPILVTGMPGVGKTALAVAWARRAAGQYPDGQLYANLRGVDPARPPADAGAVLHGLLTALDIPPVRIPPDPDARAALYRSVLAARRVLVVLDNAASVEQVRPLLPATSTCLVTSRTQLTGLVIAEGARTLPLDVLTPSAARRLLGGRAAPVADPCAGLPLALTAAAARLAQQPGLTPAALAAELRLAPLDALATDDPATNLRTAFLLSYRRLSDAAQRQFRRPGTDRAAMRELARAHLAGPHPLLRRFAAELEDRPQPVLQVAS
ncbi:ATP-binding protein [Asanoa sp. NPDC049573]|uniref:ATP-binding protein n=1 Tax=Asanoa sp. NPDC049573 TaxID=3155396 RepID=UPI0034396503